jgi:hypothetical protein
MPNKNTTTIRSLAAQLAEIARHPRQQANRNLWKAHNSLAGTRPLSFCDPENGWGEIITAKDIVCDDPYHRNFEFHLRKQIFWGSEMGDDFVIEPYISVPYAYTRSGWGLDWATQGQQHNHAYSWEAALTDYADFGKLTFPKITVDYDETKQNMEKAQELFNGILEVKLRTGWFWTNGLTHTLIFLRGLEQFLYDMYDNPDDLHRLMAFLRDAQMAELDFLEENELLCTNTEGYIGSGALGYTDELSADEPIKLIDTWGFSESQETSEVSPEMFAEFIFPYQKPILERFGLNYYGCCEAIDKRWDTIKQIPRLRRLSVSPWANLPDMAEKLGDKYILSLKPNPAMLAVPHIDKEAARNYIKNALKIANENRCHIEFIMKDNHTIGGNPQNVIDWCRIVREEIN